MAWEESAAIDGGPIEVHAEHPQFNESEFESNRNEFCADPSSLRHILDPNKREVSQASIAKMLPQLGDEHGFDNLKERKDKYGGMVRIQPSTGDKAKHE